jgi:hypothetical protein
MGNMQVMPYIKEELESIAREMNPAVPPSMTRVIEDLIDEHKGHSAWRKGW